MFTGEYHVRPENIIYASFDLCALVLGIVVLVNYAVSKKIHGKKTLLFLMLSISTVVSSALDFVSVIALSVTGCPVWLGNLLVAGNYLAYSVTGIIFIVYAVSVIYDGSRIPKICYAFAYALFYAAVAGVIFSVVCLFIYGYGFVPHYLKFSYEGIIYGCQFAALAATLILSVKRRSRLNKIKSFNIYFFCVLNMAAVAVQYFVRKLQFSNFALAIALLIIYITLQRPEDEIDATSGAFNARTFNRRGHAILSEGKPVLVFALELNNMTVVNSSFGLNGGNQVIREVADRLKMLLVKGQYLYRLSGVRFAAFFRTEEEFKDFSRRYAHVFEQPFSVNETELRLTATACIIAMPEVTDKLSEVEDLIRYYRNSVNVSEEIIEADSEALLKARRRELVDFAIQNAITVRSKYIISLFIR